MVTFSLFLLRISLIYSTFAIDMKTNSSSIQACLVITYAQAVSGISEVMLNEDVRQTNLQVAHRILQIIEEASKDGTVEIIFADDIRKYIDLLQQEGLSPLVIDSALQIRLPLYELILELPPLAKALYLLYVRHPEGLYRKQIADCKEELEALYAQTSQCTDGAKITRTINLLTDFSRKNLDKQMSLINCTFRQSLGDKAVHYLPSGGRSQLRKLDFTRVSFHLPASLSGVLSNNSSTPISNSLSSPLSNTLSAPMSGSIPVFTSSSLPADCSSADKQKVSKHNK